MSKKDEDSDSFLSKDKTVVLQEARVFNETPIQPKKCRLVLARILYLLYQSETLGTKEATETFFSITKLFQNSDPSLRQMVYLVIKELAPMAQDVIMVTSSVTKDMNARGDSIYKPNAIRALVKITDSSMVQGIERFLKQAIVDKNPSISSAAIVSALHLFSTNKEVVKRWVNEVQEAVSSRGLTTQYHALGLLYQIRQHDRMAVIKMIQSFSRSLRSPFAYCMLIRYTSKMIIEENWSALGYELYSLLQGWLNHKSQMVVIEAIRGIVAVNPNDTNTIVRAIAILHVYLGNHQTAVKFAAIKTLNHLALKFPNLVAPSNVEMEALISDPNRSIATLAITTLLKTGNEASVDRLMKQISGFMNEITDEFKIIVIEAIRSLCLKFPQKHAQMLLFLSNALRDEGGYEYKRSIVDAIFDIVHQIPESKEDALSHLCEFIEDCEYTKLAVRILHLLGTFGPTASQNPSKYIRYIYNRVILENSTVRASAIAALARFAVAVPSLRDRIRILLNRCLDDSDDEVRDRAAFYLCILDDSKLQAEYISNETVFTWATLEKNLLNYVSNPIAHADAFDIHSIPVISKTQELAEISRIKSLALEAPVAASIEEKPKKMVENEAVANAFASIPILASLGPIFKSSKPVELTESETEYVVQCIKHILAEHVVFQFTCTNTLNDSILERIHVDMKMEAEDDSLVLIESIPIERLVYDAPGNAFVIYSKPKNEAPIAYFSNTLKFIVKDCDPNTGETDEVGYDDEYLVEDIELTVGDYIIPSFVSHFENSWNEFGQEFERIETYSLTAMTNIQSAVTTMMDLLGMLACENTATNIKDRSTTHTLLLSGIFLGGIPVLARCRMAYAPSNGVTLEIAVRSRDEFVSEKLANAIQ